MIFPVDSTSAGLPEPLHVALFFAAFYFTIALLTGVWKWRAMLASPDGNAHRYIDTAHHAGLHYGPFLLLAGALASFWPAYDALPAWILVEVMGWTMLASLSRYVSLGFRKDTDNQLRRPSVFARFALVFFFFGSVLPGVAIALGAVVGLWTGLPGIPEALQ